jgi:hypothetical protein
MNYPETPFFFWLFFGNSLGRVALDQQPGMLLASPAEPSVAEGSEPSAHHASSHAN